MKNLTLALVAFLSSILSSYSQSTKVQDLNLDFEQSQNGYPLNWQSSGDNEYKIYTDSTSAESGRFSVVIENTENKTSFKAIGLNLPGNYDGKTISLSGYIKTENVTDGYAGLWMRIDPQIAFDNMNNRGVSGTTGWKKYEITLPLKPKSTKYIVIGGLLVGKGKMWLDNLKVTVDGKDIASKSIKLYTRELLPAEKDIAFDKGSNINFPRLSDNLISNLELLGKVWGFLKYHHPAISQGKYNWDYELFRILPKYLNVESKKERDAVLSEWIDKYGKVAECKKCKPIPDDAVLKPDLNWIKTTGLSENLRDKLKQIYAGRAQGEHYYISLQASVGNPDFIHENPYSNMPYPDAGFRLLALYRYWNMIEYFYPDRNLTDKNWSTVLKSYIPTFIHAKNELEYELAALQIIGEADDTHANLWSGGDKIAELRGNNYAPFRGEFVQNKFVVTDYYNPEYRQAGKLKTGDIITHINGKTIQSIIDSLRPYYPASNKAARLRDISIDLLRSPQKTINITYISANQTRQHNITLYDKNKVNMYHWYKVNQNEKCYKILSGNIGYITLANIKAEDIPEIKKSLKNTKGIIIDIRNYPSTFVPFSLGSYFMEKPTPFVKFTRGNPDNPGAFTFTDNLKIPDYKNYYKGKLIVLVNENSQSQAEYTAMAFRAVKNSLIIGSTTAGADGNVSAIVLPGGLRTMISGIGVYYPNGGKTQRIGIVPDITVKPTIEGIKQGKDEVLEKAIEIIEQ